MAETKLEIKTDASQVIDTFAEINKSIDQTEKNAVEFANTTRAAHARMADEARKNGQATSKTAQDYAKLRSATAEQVKVIQALTAARKQANNPAEIAKYNKAIDDARQKIRALHAEQNKGAKQNQENDKKQIGLINQLIQKQNALADARNKSNNPELIKRYNRLIDETKSKIDALTGTQQKASSSSGGGLFGAVLGGNIAFAAIQKVKQSIRDAVNIQIDFQKSIQNLSAITGAGGEDLAFYGQEAIRMGQHIQGGAVAAVEAFKLIGSAKPELLKNKEALVQVTEAAVTLAQASGLTLPEAAENLGIALNAFNAPAQDAGKFINVMAAAAQLGAKEIPFVTFALSKFGGVAKAANVSIEESAAAIELLGAKIPQAEAVGTNLRNILIILQAQAAEQGREFGGLREELDLLAPKVKDIAFLEKTFGRDNLLATQTLIEQREELSKLSEAVEGTGSAYEQAAKNTNTLEQSTIELSNAFDMFLLSLSKSEKVMRPFKNMVAGFTNLFKDLSQLIGGTYFDAQNTADRQMRKLTHEFVNQKISAEDYAEQVRALLVLFPKFRAEVTAAAGGAGEGEGGQMSMGIIAKLKKEISDLNEDLDAATSVKDINRITAEIKAKQAQLDALLGKANDDLKRKREEFERAIADLRKRAAQAGLESLTGQERIDAEMKFNLEELDLAIKHFEALGKAADSHFKLSLEQQKQFEILKQQIINKAADETLKLQLETQNKLNQQAEKNQDLNIQQLENQRDAEVNAIRGTKTPKGISPAQFEERQQKAILKIQQQYGLRILEMKLKNLQVEREAELAILNIKVAQGDADFTDIDLVEKKFAAAMGGVTNQIDALNNEINKPGEKPKFSLQDLLGLNDSDVQIINTAFTEVTNMLQNQLDLESQLVEQQISLSQTKIQQYQNEIESLEQKLEREMELNNEGKANNIDRINAEIAAKEAQIAKEKEIEAKNLEERKKLQKEKLNLDAALQVSNMITATANIFAATSTAGPVGVAAAIIAIGAMLAAFATTQTKARQLINDGGEQQGFKEGGYTGDGGESEPAGIVHKGEFVTTAKKTKEYRKLLAGIHEEDEGLMRQGVLDLIRNTGISLAEDLPETISAKKQLVRQSEITAIMKSDNSRMEKELEEIKQEMIKMNQAVKEKSYLNEKGDLVTKVGSHKTINRRGQL